MPEKSVPTSLPASGMFSGLYSVIIKDIFRNYGLTTGDGHLADSNTKTITKKITLVARLRLDLALFIDYVQQTPFVPAPVVDGVDDDVKNIVNDANTQIAKGFSSAKATGTAMLEEINTLTSFLDHAASWARDSSELALPIKTKVAAVNAGNAVNDEDKHQVAELVQAYIATATDFQNKANEALNSFTGNHNAMNAAIAEIQRGIEDFGNIGKKGGDLNLANLSVAEARQKLQARVSTLTTEISHLESKLNGDIAGATIGGIVGAGIALTNVWNPIGWAAGAGVIIGEVFGGEALQDQVDKINKDKEKLAVTQEEIDLLVPLHNCMRIKRKAQEIVTEITKVTTELTHLKDSFGELTENATSFNTAHMALLKKMKWHDISQDFDDLKHDLSILNVAPQSATVSKPTMAHVAAAAGKAH